MLGTIEELEKEIEQFQCHMAASGELVGLTKKLLESVKEQNENFDKRVQGIVSRLEALPASIEKTTASKNENLRKDIVLEFERTMKALELEQSRYLQNLEFVKQQIQSYMEQQRLQEQSFIDKTSLLFSKIESTPDRIISDSMTVMENIKQEIDKMLSERNFAYSAIQERIVSALNQTKSELKDGAVQLDEKYQSFLELLRKMRVAEVYEQNVQLKNELSKRTTLLLVISGLSVILGIVGLFM